MTVETITLDQMLQTYRHLMSDHQAGRMTEAQYAAALEKLQGVDANGHWWRVRPGGKFWMHDGVQWVAATPPGLAAPAQHARAENGRAATGRKAPARPRPAHAEAHAASTPAAGHAAQPGQAGAGLRGLLAATPILALVPSAVIGGLWFLYTFLGVFKGETTAGIDCVTPIFVVGLPILFWALKKPLDRLLLPLKPIIVGLAKPLRLGIVMAVPVLLSCVCTSVSTSGYLALNVSSFVSVIAAAILMRY